MIPRRAGWFVGLGLVAAAVVGAQAFAKPRKTPETDVAPVVPVEPVVPTETVETPVFPTRAAVFDAALPLDPGPIPAGIANLSAQSCSGCHYDAGESWSHGAHRAGWDSPALQVAMAQAATPACTVCHLPLAAQHADRWVYEAGDPDHPVTTANSAFDPTLATEAVTCAACHVRDGMVITAQPVTDAPHPTIQSSQLTQSSLCAACHSLTWPGADRPLYDTYGEWERSPQAKAGIQCQDCHMHRGVGDRAPSHDVAIPLERAVSVLVGIDRVDLVRGGPPLAVSVRVQNTGAGHAFPTGSPWSWVRVDAALVGPVGKKGELGPYAKAKASWPLRRTIESAPPWRTTADTTIAAGAESKFSFTPSLSVDAPSGPWALEVTLTRMIRDQPDGEPFVRQRTPLRVD